MLDTLCDVLQIYSISGSKLEETNYDIYAICGVMLKFRTNPSLYMKKLQLMPILCYLKGSFWFFCLALGRV